MSKKKNKTKKQAGRPKRKNAPPTAEAVATQCPKCKSTNRKRYTTKHEQSFGGLIGAKKYTHVVRRRTQCSDCGQIRIDKTYENRPEESAAYASADFPGTFVDAVDGFGSSDIPQLPRST